jgi:hypothetical protein
MVDVKPTIQKTNFFDFVDRLAFVAGFIPGEKYFQIFQTLDKRQVRNRPAQPLSPIVAIETCMARFPEKASGNRGAPLI